LKIYFLQVEIKKAIGINPLNTSLAILALLNREFPPQKLEKSIAYLLKKRIEDHWQAYAFCIDPAEKGQTYYAGSPVLTTAFCIAAISLFQKHTLEINSQGKNIEANIYVKEILNSKLLKFEDKELTGVGSYTS